jgi:CRP/FNR family transcriptional regulator, cyclic AMP receptor protein
MTARRSVLVYDRGCRPRNVARLLDLDPDLGELLSPERRELAARELVVRLRRLPVGPWPGDGTPRDGAGLIVAGMLSLEVMLEQRASIELLGPGDLIRSRRPADDSALLPVEVTSFVRSPLTVALLDDHCMRAASRYPEIIAGIADRLAARAERLATTQAIAQLTGVDRRLKALLWHLAERWGRVTPQGTVVGLGLTHRMLADLIGARRPPVSTALAALSTHGEVLRRPDGSWLLTGEPPGRENLSRRPRLHSPRPAIAAAGSAASP